MRRSASVDLPWSIWAMMAKLRIFAMGTAVMAAQITFAHSRGKAYRSQSQAERGRTAPGRASKGDNPYACRYDAPHRSLGRRAAVRCGDAVHPFARRLAAARGTA